MVQYLVREGETVQADQDIVEVETNKANMNVTSPCRGQVQQFLARVGDSYPVGAVLGYLEVTPEDAARAGLDATPPAKPAAESETTDPPHCRQFPANHRVQPQCGLPAGNAAGAVTCRRA